MNKNEMRVGYFGYEESDFDRLGRIFKEVERLRFPVKKEYDIYYIDLTYASQKVVDFIEGLDAIPLIIRSRFEPAEKILKFLHEDSYLVLSRGYRYFSENELDETLEEYLQRFEQKKSEYQYYKKHGKDMKGGAPASGSSESKDGAVAEPLENVWKKWKEHNKN